MVLALAGALASPAQSAPMDQDVFTDFEKLSSSPSEALLTYVHGTTPEQVTFNRPFGPPADGRALPHSIRAHWLPLAASGLY